MAIPEINRILCASSNIALQCLGKFDGLLFSVAEQDKVISGMKGRYDSNLI